MNPVNMIEHGALPAVRLQSNDGACAIITLFGAHVVAWRSADGVDRLFCSERSRLDGSSAIRGGIPIIFPQFGARGPGTRHGFARTSAWRLIGSGAQDGAAFALLALAPADLASDAAQDWPYAFGLLLRVSVSGDALKLTLEVRNTGAAAFAFSSALHTYFLVDRLEHARIGGLADGELRIDDKIDAIRHGVGDLTLSHGAGALHLTQSGFCDAVLWNPGALDAAALPDLDDAEYQRFVCIEAALIDPLTLGPGAAWRGEHRISVA